MLDDFTSRTIATAGARIFLRQGGNGPPLLLLHGYPQTHVMWHRVAPVLAERFTVVCPDLRGYGDSSKPAGGTDHAAYAKRAMAQDMVEVMAALGHERFMVAGHDRGGRVAHRLCLDHPGHVARAAVLDIVPTRTVFAATDQALATGYYHWFFLSQPAPLPERLIGHERLFYLHAKLARWAGTQDLSWLDPAALGEYERCFTPATIHASCDDYRAAATLDLADDAADETARIACPLLVLWGDKGVVHRYFEPLRDWGSVATDVRGRAVPSGHYIPEEIPDVTYAELSAFLRG